MSRVAPPISIGIVCASLSRTAGGILPIMQGHASELVKLGATVSAYGIADEFSEADEAGWNMIPRSLHDPVVSKFAFAPGLNRALAGAQHDVLHQHGLWLYPSLVMSARRRAGCPVIISTQGMLEPWALANAKQKKRIAMWLFERKNLEGASCIHCSRAEVEAIRALGLKTPIAVIPNGAPQPEKLLTPPRPVWLPQDGRRMLLFLGRLHPKKGIRETLDAWALLKSRDPALFSRWRLVIAGWDDGGNGESLMMQARTLGLSEVIFSGPVFGAEKEATFAHADAFVLASYSEGSPIAVLEAWAHGLPVFMTRGCNLPEGFQAGAAIEISTDASNLANALKDGLSRGDLVTVGTRGLELVATCFSWPTIAADLFAVYGWASGRGPKPRCVTQD